MVSLFYGSQCMSVLVSVCLYDRVCLYICVGIISYTEYLFLLCVLTSMYMLSFSLFLSVLPCLSTLLVRKPQAIHTRYDQ